MCALGATLALLLIVFGLVGITCMWMTWMHEVPVCVQRDRWGRCEMGEVRRRVPLFVLFGITLFAIYLASWMIFSDHASSPWLR